MILDCKEIQPKYKCREVCKGNLSLLHGNGKPLVRQYSPLSGLVSQAMPRPLPCIFELYLHILSSKLAFIIFSCVQLAHLRRNKTDLAQLLTSLTELSVLFHHAIVVASKVVRTQYFPLQVELAQLGQRGAIFRLVK